MLYSHINNKSKVNYLSTCYENKAVTGCKIRQKNEHTYYLCIQKNTNELQKKFL